jgi:hypothetical protein
LPCCSRCWWCGWHTAWSPTSQWPIPPRADHPCSYVCTMNPIILLLCCYRAMAFIWLIYHPSALE